MQHSSKKCFLCEFPPLQVEKVGVALPCLHQSHPLILSSSESKTTSKYKDMGSVDLGPSCPADLQAEEEQAEEDTQFGVRVVFEAPATSITNSTHAALKLSFWIIDCFSVVPILQLVPTTSIWVFGRRRPRCGSRRQSTNCRRGRGQTQERHSTTLEVSAKQLNRHWFIYNRTAPINIINCIDIFFSPGPLGTAETPVLLSFPIITTRAPFADKLKEGLPFMVKYLIKVPPRTRGKTRFSIKLDSPTSAKLCKARQKKTLSGIYSPLTPAFPFVQKSF